MPGRIIVITSGKGGVGKTTATFNIGAGLAVKGNRVVVIDMDIGLRNLDIVMGLENRIVFTIVDAINGRCRIKQALIKNRKFDNLYLIPASQSDNKDALTPESVIKLCENLRKEFDFILIDCPAGIEQGFVNSVSAADEAIVVCTPEVTSIRDADRVIGLLYSRQITPKLLINRIVPEMVAKRDMLNHKDVLEFLSIELIGLVPMEEQVIICTNNGIPLVTRKASKAGEAFLRVAMRINGDSNLPIEVPKNHKSFWDKIGVRLKKK
ncbi:MAG: septum site-determining protein MinD [Desulfobacterales bacterium]|nr:septum site-determining protein MinD [Desulfobacterales bacterium]